MTAFALALPFSAATRRTVAAALLTAAAGLPFTTAQAQDGPQLNLQRVELTAGMHRIDAQVAATPQERQTGLMHRKEMPLRPAGPTVLLDEEHAAAAHGSVCG